MELINISQAFDNSGYNGSGKDFTGLRQSDQSRTQDEIACFRISETWRKHAAPWFRYIYVLRKRENSNLRDSVRSQERKCQVMFPSYLSQQISAVVRFRHVSANGFASWYMSHYNPSNLSARARLV